MVVPANFFMAYFPSPNFDTRFSVSATESSTRRGNCSRLENYEKTTSWRRRRNLERCVHAVRKRRYEVLEGGRGLVRRGWRIWSRTERSEILFVSLNEIAEKLSAYLSRLQDGDNEIGSKSLRGNIVQTGGIVRRGSDFNADRKFNLHCGPGRCPCTRQGYIESKLVTSGRAGKACSSISQSNEHGVSRSRGRKRMLIKFYPKFRGWGGRKMSGDREEMPTVSALRWISCVSS